MWRASGAKEGAGGCAPQVHSCTEPPGGRGARLTCDGASAGTGCLAARPHGAPRGGRGDNSRVVAALGHIMHMAIHSKSTRSTSNPHALQSVHSIHSLYIKLSIMSDWGVVCHLGAVPQAGHYVAKARHDGVWYRYDDVRREELRRGQPLAGPVEKAYLLAYEFDGEEAVVG